MFRHALTILLTVALLLGVSLLALRQLGWLNPHQLNQQQTPGAAQRANNQDGNNDARPTNLSPSPETTRVNESVPVVPADPITPPAQPSLPPGDPLPRVAPTPPTPQVTLLPPAPPPPVAPPVAPPVNPSSSRSPLAALNAVRTLAGLPSVRAEPKWQAECDAHANYLAVTDTGSHSEDPSNPHYTQAGANCAHGHYYVTMRPEATGTQAITYWQNGPFHLPQLIDPRLTHAALAVKHDASGDLRTAAVLDVKRGRSGPAKYPVRFPRPGSTVTPQSLSQFEYPDALPGCPGYTHPAGAPIALLLGYGQVTRTVNVRVNGQPVESCLLTAQTFSGSSPGDTSVGRSVLDAQGVAVVIPRHPLPGAARVDVRFGTASGLVSWSFRTR